VRPPRRNRRRLLGLLACEAYTSSSTARLNPRLLRRSVAPGCRSNGSPTSARLTPADTPADGALASLRRNPTANTGSWVLPPLPAELLGKPELHFELGRRGATVTVGAASVTVASAV